MSWFGRVSRRGAAVAAACIAVLGAGLPAAVPASADGSGTTLVVYVSPSVGANVEVWQNGLFVSFMHYRSSQDGSDLHFELDDLSAGSYQLFADVSDDSGLVARGWYVSATTSSATIGSAAKVSIGGSGTTTLSWKLSAGSTVDGKITDSAGRPISGLCFDIAEPNGSDVGGGQTASNGAFSYTHILPGLYLLSYYGCEITDKFANAPWGYPLAYWNGTASGSPTKSGAKPVKLTAAKTSSASVRIAANGLVKGSLVYPSDSSFEQVQAYAGKTVSNGARATAAATVSGSSYSIVVPAAMYHVAFYCQGARASATCSTGIYNWYGGGGFISKAKAVVVQPGEALTVNEGAIPSVVAENYVHLRRKTTELVSVYCIFSRSTCTGSETLSLTVAAIAKHGKATNFTYTKSFRVKPHSTSLLSYALPSNGKTAIAKHKKLKAALTLKVRGQSSIIQKFSIS